MTRRNSNTSISTSTLSLESNFSFSLSQKIKRADQISPTSKEDGASESRITHSGKTSNSNATSHLSGANPENELSGPPTVEMDPINAAASRYTDTQLLYCKRCYLLYVIHVFVKKWKIKYFKLYSCECNWIQFCISRYENLSNSRTKIKKQQTYRIEFSANRKVVIRYF